ncbi:hypothetical protein K6Y31_21990, partial [Motilimonas cestriensis]|nr:hypothetical protein [Motilimonas cestriensis]
MSVLGEHQYDENTGLLAFDTDGNGVKTQYLYDAIGRQWKVIRDADGDKLTTEYGYNNKGQQIWIDVEGERTDIQFDNNNRQVRVSQGGVATEYVYDGLGRVVNQIEGGLVGDSVLEERITAYHYDAQGNQVKSKVRSGKDWKGAKSSQTVNYEYNRAGQRTAQSVVAEGTGVTRTLYNELGQVRFQVNALNYVTELFYDAAGQVTHKRQYAGVVSGGDWTEAAVAERIHASEADDRVTEYRYDADGRVTLEINPAGYGTGYQYNDNGRVVTTTRYSTKVTEPGWETAADNRLTRTVYNDKGELWFSIGSKGEITERRYDKVGRLSHTMRYDAAFLPADNSDASLIALLSALQEADAATTRTELRVYDSLGRLRFSQDGDGFLVEYQYNRLSQTVRKREYIDNQAVSKALQEVQAGQTEQSLYES